MDYNFGLPFCKLMKRFLYFVFLILEKAIADSDDSSSVDNEINSSEMEDEENVSFLNKVDQQAKWKFQYTVKVRFMEPCGKFP